MRWIYKMQQHLAITATECWALTGLFGLLAVGLLVQEVQEQQSPVEPEAIAAVHAAFQVALRDTVRADSAATQGGDTLQVAMRPASVVPDTIPRPKRKAKGQPARMNINTAGPGQLVRLPGIGPKLAERVVAYRTQRGPFRKPEDLIGVKGIGQKKLEKMLPYVFVADSVGGR